MARPVPGISFNGAANPAAGGGALSMGILDTGNPQGIEDPHSFTKQRKAKIFRAAKPKRARAPRIKGTRIPFPKKAIQYPAAQAPMPKAPNYGGAPNFVASSAKKQAAGGFGML